MKYCIIRAKKKEYTAGIKAPDDIAAICKQEGYELIRWRQFPSARHKLIKKLWLLLFVNLQWMQLVARSKAHDIVLYQHPSYGYRAGLFWIKRLKKKQVDTIALIHDLESLRKGVKNHASYNEERSILADDIFLKEFGYVICHNEHMRQYMIGQGFRADRLYNLEIFDYLAEIKKDQQKEDQKTYTEEDALSIAIAGNLAVEKSGYIYQVTNQRNDGLKVQLYGVNYDETNKDGHLIYHGSYRPEELPDRLKGDFGLVWDGNSAETCSGNTGEYLRYNNPHKTSLYLAAGIPVIVWKEAAITDFVVQNQVGFTVEKLEEIEPAIRTMGKAEYDRLASHAKETGQKIRSGFYTRQVLRKIEKYIRKRESGHV